VLSLPAARQPWLSLLGAFAVIGAAQLTLERIARRAAP
jgi:hypothetical protein